MSPNCRFRKLFEPRHIAELELRNRIVMAPMGTNYATEDGYITDRIKNYYEERAKGGVGLIIVEVGSIDHPRGSIIPRQIGISNDKFIPGLRSLVQVVHKHGAKIAIQLNHGGKLSRQDLTQGHAPVTPSPASTLMTEMVEGLTKQEITRLAIQFANMPADKMTKELTVEEIKSLVQKYAEAAERAKRAGFDSVEIHAGHGYLIAEFLSRSSNKRQDAYGGDLQNRARLLLEIIEAIKQKVGDGYPVWCRIDGKEYNIEDGITNDEAQQLAVMLDGVGTDAIHVSGYGGAGLGGFYNAPLVYSEGNLVPLAIDIKKLVSIPVITVGRINPQLAEEILHDGKADFIAMGRQLLADPQLPNKLASGQEESIRPCIMCYCCVNQIFWGESVYCTVNPATGNESQLIGQPAQIRKKIIIVGGGPAGIMAAITAAKRGHDVTLFEKENCIGGQFYIAGIPPFKEQIHPYLNFLKREVHASGVNLILGKEATSAELIHAKPDVVVIATGGRPLIPEIPGIYGAKVVTAHNVIAGKAVAGNRVLIAGGGLVGCEAADLLSSRGKEVTLVEMLPNVASDMVVWLRMLILQRLQQAGIKILTSTTVVEFTSDGAVIERDGKRETIDFMDTIVLALGVESANDLSEILRDRISEVYVIGDAKNPGKVHDAIVSGAEIGMQI